MRFTLPAWALLLIAAILFVAGLFWVRAHPAQKDNPLAQATDNISLGLGMEVEPAPGPEGGLLVKEVRPKSVAEHVGVKVGERVVAVGDRSVWHAVQLEQFISEEMSTTGSCTIMLVKGNVYRTVTLGFARVAPPPAPEGRSQD
jgi:S1-C subfamily serine protease